MKYLLTAAFSAPKLRSPALAANVLRVSFTTAQGSSAKMTLAVSTAGAAISSSLEQFELLAATNAANNTAAAAPRVWNALAGVLGLSSLGEALGLITVFGLALTAVALRAPALAVRFWSAAVGKLPVRGPKTLLASNVTPARGGYVSAFAAYFACASDGTTPGDGGPPSGDPLLLLLLAGAAMGAVLAVTWLLFGANDKPRGEAPSPPPTPKEVTPPAEPTFPEPVGVGRVAPFPHPYAFPRPAIQLSWSPELLWKLTIFGGIVLGLIVLSGFFGGPEGGDGGVGSTTERGAGSGGGAGNNDGGSGRGGAAKKRVWQKPKRRPLPARYATAAPAATPTSAIPTAVGPVSVGPASAPTASAPTAAPIPTAVEDDNSSVYDENELPPSRSPSPPLQPTPATPTAVAPSPAVPAPAGPASETPSPAGPQPTSPLSDVEGPPPFDFDRFLREVSPTPYAHLTGRQLRDLMAEEMGYGPQETQETQETQEVRESGTAPPGEAKGGDPSSTEPPLRWRNWARKSGGGGLLSPRLSPKGVECRRRCRVV